ncbi:hypothetical protein [Streptomyces sp. NPDC101160]
MRAYVNGDVVTRRRHWGDGHRRDDPAPRIVVGSGVAIRGGA